MLVFPLLYTGTSQAQQLTISSVTPNPVCAASSITVSYSYTTGDAGTLYLFLNGPNTSDMLIGATSVNGGNGSMQGTIPANRTTGTYTVRLIRQSATTGVVVNSLNSNGFTVNARPSAPGVSNVAYCQGATGIQSLTANGQNLTWYPNVSGGGGTTVAPTPPTSSTGTTDYYLSQTVNDCEGPRANLQVTINPPPVKPTVVASLSYCQGVTAPSLASAVNSGSNLKWYNSALSGTGSTVAPTPSTSDVGSIMYYVSQTNFSNQTDGSGCESERAAITVTTKAAPAAPSVTSPVIYCQDAVAGPLSATAVAGGTLNWYGTSNNALGSTTPTPPTTSPGTTYYSVSQTFGGCEGTKATIPVTINTRPVVPATTPISVCQNTTPVSLSTGVTSGTNLKWYTASSGNIGETVAPTVSTTAVGSATFYVSQTSSDGCESDRSALGLTVNPLPLASILPTSGTVTCASTSLTLTASGGNGYTFSGPGVLSQQNGLAVVNAGGLYSVTVTNTTTGCSSVTTTTVYSDTAVPNVAIIPSSTVLTSANPSVNLTAQGTGNFLWSTGSTFPVISVSTSGIYSVSLTGSNGCTASTSVTVTGSDLTINLDLPQANFASSGSVGNFVVNIFEVAGQPTSSGKVTITITAPVGYTLAFTPSLTSTNVSGGERNPVVVNNGQWAVSGTVSERQLTLTMNSGMFIGGGGESSIGFSLTRTSANSGSTASITVNVKDDLTAGYDSNLSNNVYARVISGL
ncbi:hypothetical protein EXU85_30205 [Spirosoma sp. KCTC 42546]|uniref:Ig-like domain-containing protein n=1 Tax=Spirosoma sp. KCTC 42546 TaxID=2520506 RepID=UPI00115B07CC|nr:hypothetical protein [Spirosoma sp. KCTC 42546]QDK82652.1 hypothetical protein EXU85_30205 [Spirosoma sp. KCTC 42546]